MYSFRQMYMCSTANGFYALQYNACLSDGFKNLLVE